MNDENKCCDARCNAMVATIRLRMHDETATAPGTDFAAGVLAARLKDLVTPIADVLDDVEIPIRGDARDNARAALSEIIGLANALARTR